MEVHTSKKHANGHSLWVCENVTSHAMRAANTVCIAVMHVLDHK